MKPDVQTPETHASVWFYWTCRALMAGLAVVLIGAAAIKAADMQLFIRQIKEYGVIASYPLLPLAAWGLIIVETALGAALLTAFRPRLTLPATAGLFVLFIAATLWAWRQGVVEDCGCFGSLVKRSPGQAALEDTVFLAAACVAWIGARQRGSRSRIAFWVTAMACVAGCAMPLAWGFSLSGLSGPSRPEGADLGSLATLQGRKVDWDTGARLVVLMDTGCDHCQQAVGALNDMVEMKNRLPQILALCMNGAEERKRFLDEFGPRYPLYQISEKDFWRLLGDGPTPRFFLLRDRRVLQAWDLAPPDPAALVRAMAF